jgi:hypothetical protein
MSPEASFNTALPDKRRPPMAAAQCLRPDERGLTHHSHWVPVVQPQNRPLQIRDRRLPPHGLDGEDGARDNGAGEQRRAGQLDVLGRVRGGEREDRHLGGGVLLGGRCWDRRLRWEVEVGSRWR